MVLAYLAMIVDHVGVLFYPDQIWMRMVGRMAMPMFAYCVGLGMVRTKDKKRYIQRLFILACLTQAVHWVVINNGLINPVVSLGLGAVVLSRPGRGVRFAMEMVGAALLVSLVPVEYGAYGLLLVVLFGYLIEVKGQDLDWASGVMAVMTFAYCLQIKQYLPIYGMFFLLLVMLGDSSRVIIKNRFLKYSIYPGHLVILGGLKWVIA